MEEHHLTYFSEEGEVTDVQEGSRLFTLGDDTSLPPRKEPRETSGDLKTLHMPQTQHLAVSVEASRLPELRQTDKGDLLRYIDQVRRVG